MKRILFFLIAFSFGLKAQLNQQALVFVNTEFNFGKVENWISKIDTIQITNNTAKKVFILKQHYSAEFEFRYPTGGIEAGQTGFVEIILMCFLPVSISVLTLLLSFIKKSSTVLTFFTSC